MVWQYFSSSSSPTTAEAFSAGQYWTVIVTALLCLSTTNQIMTIVTMIMMIVIKIIRPILPNPTINCTLITTIIIIKFIIIIIYWHSLTQTRKNGSVGSRVSWNQSKIFKILVFHNLGVFFWTILKLVFEYEKNYLNLRLNFQMMIKPA